MKDNWPLRLFLLIARLTSYRSNNMPAKSKAQKAVMAIAEHEPSKLYKSNAGLKKMSKKQLHDFASTKGKLPKKVKSKGR